MDKKTLTEIGLNDEQISKVLKSLASGYISKEQAENSRKKTEEETLAKIAELQKGHDDKVKSLKINSALDKALVKNKSRNDKALKALMDEYLKPAELDESGNVIGLDEEIERLKTSEDSSMLFSKDERPVLKGFVPAESADGLPENNPFSKESYNLTEQAKLYKQDSGKAKTFAAAVGVKI